MNSHLDSPLYRSLIVAVLFTSISAVHAADYYVSTTGNDTTGTGSAAAPFRTPQRAVKVAPAGSRIIFRGGTYTGGIYFEQANLTLQSADGEWAVFTIPN